jgi:hypothetical protein
MTQEDGPSLGVLGGMRRSLTLTLAAAASAAVLVPAAAQADGVKRTAAGADPASIQAAVDAFRADLGGNNNGGGGPQPAGRREIGWDGVPEANSDPNPFPAGTFLGRGVLFATPGTGFQVSANAPSPVRFNNPEFQTFSPQKLFTAVGSTITDTHFFVPGSATPATTNGMGVVFTDVDSTGSAKLEYFDAAGNLIDTVVAPASPNGGLSFAGETFTGVERVSRVRITSGTSTTLTSDPAGQDTVAMDDFIYGEPLAGKVTLAPAGGTPTDTPKPPVKIKVKLYKLTGSLRYLLASDEAGTYRIKLTVTSAQADRLGLQKRTLYSTGSRKLQDGGNALTLKIGKSIKAKLRKAAIKPTLAISLSDGSTLRQRIAV